MCRQRFKYVHEKLFLTICFGCYKRHAQLSSRGSSFVQKDILLGDV
jgi:hypothetical protein